MILFESLARRLTSLEHPLTTATALDRVPVQARSFHHGERTADLGTLGDDSGRIVLWPDQDGLDGASRIEWAITTSMDGRVASCSVKSDGSGDDADGCAGSVDGRNGAINVYAGKPGRFFVRLFEVRGSGDRRRRGELLGWQVLSVPQFVRVRTDQALRNRVDAVASNLSVSATAEDKREAVLGKAKRIAAHVLRPANVRVVWDDLGDSLPTQFDGSASEDQNGLVTGVPNPESFPGCASDHLIEITLAGTGNDVTVNEYGQELSDGSPTGRIAVDENLAPVGNTATADDLRTHLSGLSDAETQLDRAARWLGVVVARSALVGIGIEENEPVDAYDDAHERYLYEQALHGGDVMNESPEHPVSDLLGVELGDSATDLVERYREKFGMSKDDSGALTVLDRTTPYDVLLGAVGTNPDDQDAQDGTLDRIEDEVPLGPPYGGWHLRAGDEDASGGGSATYEGAERTDPAVLPSSDEPGYVRLLQDDLRLLGIELAPPEGDTDGSGRMGDPDEGDENNSTALHTEWALREFQIALSYPNAAVHQFAGEETYGDNLSRIPNPTRVTSGEGNDLNMEPAKRVVTGVVDSLTGYRLRRWRFRRARYPIVVEARDSNDYSTVITYDTDSDGNPDRRLDNVWDATALRSNGPRVFVRDLSDHVDVAPDEEVESGLRLHTLGDRGSYETAEGPHMSGSNHGRVPTVPGNYHATAESPTDLGDDELAVFKTIAAATFEESAGYFDVVNCYDNQVLSHPLCHYVFGSGEDAQSKGEWPGFLAALHHEHPELYMRIYGSRGVWPSAMYGRPSDGSRVSEYTWTDSGKHTGYVYILHREIPDDEQVDGDLGVRGMTGAGDTSVTENDRRGYAQWFRTWHWMYRVVASIRDEQEIRRFMYQFAVRRILDIEDAYGLPESEFGVTVAHRIHVVHPNTARLMLDAASGESNETDRIEAMIDAGYAKATGTVTFEVDNGGVTVPGETVVQGTDSDGNTYGFTTNGDASPSTQTPNPTTVDARVTADDYGEGYNLEANVVTDLPAPPDGVNGVASASETSGGAEQFGEEAKETVRWPVGDLPGIDDNSDLGAQQTYNFDVVGDGQFTTRLSADANSFPDRSTVENFATPRPSLPNSFDDRNMDRPWEWVEKDSN